MKHAVALIVLLSVTAMAWIGETNRVEAQDPLQSISTPTPVPTRIPPQPLTSTVTFTIGTLKSQGISLSKEKTFARLNPTTPVTAGDFVDNWETLVQDNFEGTFPITSSYVISEGTFYGPLQGRLWGQDTLHAVSGVKSIWPARGGPNGLDPATNNYPPGLDSWLVCGPYDFTNAQYVQVNFEFWREFTDPNDFMAVVYSNDGASWPGVIYPGLNPLPPPQWVTQTLSFPISGLQQIEGQPQVWVAIVFRSNTDNNTGKGVWVDDLRIWRYNKPLTTCATLDLGNKAVNISAYDTVNNVIYPTIRAGDTQVVQGLMAAGAHWARLPILQNNAVSIDDQAYDRMVDTLCNAGISTMLLFDHESLTRSVSDADNDTTAASYRTDFANRANALATHFKGRVKYWQVWNEPVAVVKLSDSHYAALLTQTANSIKTADPNAKVVAAGLDHAWNVQNNYLIQVYLKLNQEQNGARPFDVFAVHPYNDNQQYSMNPVGYMHAITEMNVALGDKTIVDKFVRTMETNQDTGKKVWISEVGWNSSLGAQNAPWFAVSETTQAFYLQHGFDILFNEARSVDKVFWFKYLDENVQTNAPTFIRIQNGEEWLLRHPDLQVYAPSSPSLIVPGWWGLYRTTKLDAKPSRCAFLYYPQRCPDLPPPLFLPLIIR